MPPRFIGVVHLPPLPGGPRPSPGLDAVIERAVADAETLARGGADGLVVENLGDAPFAAEQVDPYTIAAMTRAVAAVRVAVPTLELGVNVLRNDAAAALSIAAATDASFIRINVHIGAMITDQGLIQGQARETLLLRRRLAAEVKIVADVLVKHASPLGSPSLEDAARDTAERGLADVLVVTGSGTGQPTDPNDLRRVHQVAPDTPVWVGSGLTPETVQRFDRLDGAIVGTWLHRDGILDHPLELARVEAMRGALSPRRS